MYSRTTMGDTHSITSYITKHSKCLQCNKCNCSGKLNSYKLLLGKSESCPCTLLCIKIKQYFV